jgi:hypothetical protein
MLQWQQELSPHRLSIGSQVISTGYALSLRRSIQPQLVTRKACRQRAAADGHPSGQAGRAGPYQASDDAAAVGQQLLGAAGGALRGLPFCISGGDVDDAILVGEAQPSGVQTEHHAAHLLGARAETQTDFQRTDEAATSILVFSLRNHILRNTSTKKDAKWDRNGESGMNMPDVNV